VGKDGGIKPSSLADADFMSMRVSGLALGQVDLEYAVLIGGADVAAVHIRRKRQIALEGSIRAFHTNIILILVFFSHFLLMLSFERNDPIADDDVDLILAEARQLGVDGVVVLGLD